MNYVVFDIETYSPSKSEKFDVNEFKVSVTGAYFSWIDEYLAFVEDNTKDFIDIMKQAELVVGYNHIAFDNAVLQKYDPNFDLVKDLPNYDIMLAMKDKIGFNLRLNDLVKATLGDNKTDSYDQFKHYYWDKEWYKLIDYCMHDVRLTNELFQRILDGKPLFYNNLHEKIEVVLEKPKAGKVKVLEDTGSAIF